MLRLPIISFHSYDPDVNTRLEEAVGDTQLPWGARLIIPSTQFFLYEFKPGEDCGDDLSEVIERRCWLASVSRTQESIFCRGVIKGDMLEDGKYWKTRSQVWVRKIGEFTIWTPAEKPARHVIADPQALAHLVRVNNDIGEASLKARAASAPQLQRKDH